jgi:SAM-dependent methyltransferase
MDRATLAAYDFAARSYAKRWLAQDEPVDLYALFRRYFRPGLTADIGCGSGRDAAWLNANGFPTIGYDVSEGLLAQARARYPQLEFETVIMHLPRDEIAPAVSRMMTILKPGGVLYLSWRVTANADRRDENGRLFTAFASDLVRGALPDQVILLDEEIARSSGAVHRLVARAS